MKFRSYCCCWLTLLLVGSTIISVSPNSATTATTTFQKHRKQTSHIQNSSSSKDPNTRTVNTFDSIENSYFASTTMTQHQQKHKQQSPDSVMMVMMPVQQVATIITSTSFPLLESSKTTSSISLSSSSSSSSLSTSLSSSSFTKESTTESATSVAIASNIIRSRRKPSLLVDIDIDDDNKDDIYDESSLHSASSVLTAATRAMVHHHYPDVRNTTESYPSMFFQLNTPSIASKDQYQSQITTKQRWKRDNEDVDFDKCRTFVEDEPNQNQFYSPDYPNDYPKNINCTRTISAPEGQLIRLDFRNTFNIESKEGCKFDYLEIRDGFYGFSNLIGKFCGEEFPPMILSKERHLWLHFHSDESIEYSGFTAVYEFYDRPKEVFSTDLNCTIETTDDYEGFVNSSQVPLYVRNNVTKYKIPIDCMWIIRVQPEWKIQLKFLDFSLNKPNDCDVNFIDIFGEDTNIPSRMKNFCGSTGEPLQSASNVLHIRFFAEQKAINSSFNILYTAFREKGTGPKDACREDEYDCEDATCIHKDLKCNERTNCKFRWDEENCDNKAEGWSEHVIIICVVFGLILGGMVVTFFVNCVRKIMRDQKIIREHIRQSKESKLDEMGRSRSRSKQRSKDNVSGVLSPRQKHSQTSLQILDDVSQRYYREAVPISMQSGKTDLKDIKDHSILRHHHDMVVQTSLGDDSSTPDRGIVTGVGSGNVCDMGCQTRESLFQPLVKQKSITSSSPNQSTAAAIRFSTFGYDIPQPPMHGGTGLKSATLSRQSSINNQPESIELEERLRIMPHNNTMQHPYNQRHGHLYSGVSGEPIQVPATMPRPPQEVCHHHHQHQQHLQKHQTQQQLQQQMVPASNPGGHHQHSHHASGKMSGGGGGGSTTQTTTGGVGGKHHKHDETSKVFIDIRNSAPDVIIMTSH